MTGGGTLNGTERKGDIEVTKKKGDIGGTEKRATEDIKQENTACKMNVTLKRGHAAWGREGRGLGEGGPITLQR